MVRVFPLHDTTKGKNRLAAFFILFLTKKACEFTKKGSCWTSSKPRARRKTARRVPVNKIDWLVYRSAFRDTPIHAAETALFSEYALLVGRIIRHLGTARATPLNSSEGAAIAHQAQEFILGYVNPILGPTRTTEFHRVLCHILHWVQYHGNILNAKKSANESVHKADDRPDTRTDHKRGFTRKRVRHEHGTRLDPERNAAALKKAETAAA